MDKRAPIRIILFNGPPGAGKDAATHALFASDLASKYHLKLDRFTMPLKKMIGAAFDVSVKVDGDSIFELSKDASNETLGGVSYRLLQNRLGNFLRDTYGPGFLGKLLARRITMFRALNETLDKVVYVVPDLGNDEELSYLLTYFDPKEILVVQIVRPPKTFLHDVRRFVKSDGIPNFKCVTNGGDLSAFEAAIYKEVKSFLRAKSREDKQKG